MYTYRTPHMRPWHNRLLGVTNLVSLKYFSLKSVLNSFIGLPNSVTLATAWLWMTTAAIDMIALGAIAIYSFLGTHLIAVFILYLCFSTNADTSLLIK